MCKEQGIAFDMCVGNQCPKANRHEAERARFPDAIGESEAEMRAPKSRWDFGACLRRALVVINIWLWGACIGLLASSNSVSALALDPITQAEEIVRVADDFRGQTSCFRADLKVTYSKPGYVEESIFELFAKGLDKSLLVYKLPKREAGKKLLSVGDNLYMYFPNTRRPMRVPYEQRLMGQVSNADLTRIYFARDYAATFLEKKKIAERNCWIFQLRAKSTSAPYAFIQYGVEENTARPIFAKYFTAAGRLFKSAEFELKIMPYDNREHVFRMVIQDEILRGENSVIEFVQVEPAELSDEMFLKQKLAREII